MYELYKRDYKKLTEKELTIYEEMKIFKSKKSKIVSANDATNQISNYFEFPALIFYESLFPNNYVDTNFLIGTHEKYKEILAEFISLIENRQTIESQILKFIKINEFYPGIITLLLNTQFWGHEEFYLFREFQLGNEFRTDFLLIGKNSNGYSFVFVEFEGVYGRITTKKGDLGQVINTGLNQVDRWKQWLESNYTNLNVSFTRTKNQNQALPTEFYKFDSTKVSYIVVAGRRSDFCEISNRKRRVLDQKSNTKILHYDNLLENMKKLITS